MGSASDNMDIDLKVGTSMKRQDLIREELR